MTDVPQQRVDRTFLAYPKNKVVGILDTPETLQAALEALQQAGIDLNDISTLCGEAGIKRINRSGKGHGLVAQLIRLVQFIGEEQVHLHRYHEALTAGHFLVAVTVGMGSSTKTKLRDILRAHGGHYLHYYGKYAVEDL